MEEDTIFKVTNLTIGVGSTELLRNVNFSIHSGDIIALLGKNGSGKTTLLRTLIGYSKPIRGEISYKQRSIFTLPDPERTNYICYVPQRLDAIPHITVTEFLSACTRPLISKSSHQIEAAIENCDLGTLRFRFLPQLSGGELRRTLLAIAYLSDAQLLLFDEPSSNLDPTNHSAILKLIKKLAASKKAILFTTHDLVNDVQSATRVLAIRRGETIELENKQTGLSTEALESIYDIRFNRSSSNNFPCLVPADD